MLYGKYGYVEKYSTVVFLGVKFQYVTTATIDSKLNPLNMSTLHGALLWPVMRAWQNQLPL